jgi:hypothetical protein
MVLIDGEERYFGPVLFRFVSRNGILGTLLSKRKEKLTCP